jgi:hypothetical protein
MGRRRASDTEPVTAVFKRRRELRRAMRVARMLAALEDAAAGATRERPRPRTQRAFVGSARV